MLHQITQHNMILSICTQCQPAIGHVVPARKLALVISYVCQHDGTTLMVVWGILTVSMTLYYTCAHRIIEITEIMISLSSASSSCTRICLLVGECLKHVRPICVLVPEHMVVGRAGGSLDARVAHKEEVVLCWMSDIRIHHCACSIGTGGLIAAKECADVVLLDAA